jgi:hypothetical protein
MSFSNLKSRSADITKLVAAAEQAGGGSGEKKSYGDDRFWKPEVDKSGNGYAVLRFLPAPEGEDLPWVKYWDHGFQGPTGQWYIENSLTTIGQDDPVSEMNSVLWATGREEDKDLARKRKRRLHYVSNVMIVSDPAHPENNGKVMLFKFGKKIFDKIMDVMQPQFADETPVNPYDFWEGANFKLKIRNVEGYRNYDKSEFDGPTPLMGGDDAKLESVYNTLHSLKDFVDPKNYKSYSELKAKLLRVLGEAAAVMTTAEAVTLDTSTSARTMREEPEYSPQSSDGGDGDDDTLSYFKNLANG